MQYVYYFHHLRVGEKEGKKSTNIPKSFKSECLVMRVEGERIIRRTKKSNHRQIAPADEIKVPQQQLSSLIKDGKTPY
jgi:hypothetical protein